MAIRSNSQSLTEAASKTLDAIPFDPRDATLRTLIQRYCAEIDATGDLEKYGSRLLSALTALEATPRARRTSKTGESIGDELEAFFGASGE